MGGTAHDKAWIDEFQPVLEAEWGKAMMAHRARCTCAACAPAPSDASDPADLSSAVRRAAGPVTPNRKARRAAAARARAGRV